MDTLWTCNEVGNYLQKSRQWVVTATANGLLPHTTVGGDYRYRKIEIDQWLASRDGQRARKPRRTERPLINKEQR
jgi:excisionase family DNA binding protein